MKIKIASFRTKIIVTLVFVVSVTSFVSFQLYEGYLARHIYKEAENNFITLLHFLRNELITIDDGRLIKGLLKDMEKEEGVLKTYLIDSSGKFISSENDTIRAKGTVNLKDLNGIKEDISVQTNNKNPQPYTRAILRVKNVPSCFKCHSPEIKNLGYIVIDFSLEETNDKIAFNLRSSVFFTFLMVMVIMIFIAFLHYRFVKKSLAHFSSAINEINNGNLEKRVKITESEELGKLGKNFNQMLDRFQLTQNELHQYHQKELIDAHKLATLGEMAARLAHEVRNPLMGIANSIEIIVGDMPDSPDKPILEEIQRQAGRVNQAITNLLKFSRSSEIQPKMGNINELVASLVFFLKNQHQNKAIDFISDLQTEIPPFKFDPEQVENVLLNLGMNAIQAMEDEGTLIFRTKFAATEKLVVIEVEDTGPGIPPDNKDEVFSPFFTTRTEGTGLGLAIVKDIVGKHNGTVTFFSNANRGTTFVVILPCKSS